MKKALFTLSFLISTAVLMIGADFRKPDVAPVAEIKQLCKGYSILEAGKGIDCNGDTVKLVKKYGYYELASRANSTSTIAANVD